MCGHSERTTLRAFVCASTSWSSSRSRPSPFTSGRLRVPVGLALRASASQPCSASCWSRPSRSFRHWSFAASRSSATSIRWRSRRRAFTSAPRTLIHGFSGACIPARWWMPIPMCFTTARASSRSFPSECFRVQSSSRRLSGC